MCFSLFTSCKGQFIWDFFYLTKMQCFRNGCHEHIIWQKCFYELQSQDVHQLSLNSRWSSSFWQFVLQLYQSHLLFVSLSQLSYTQMQQLLTRGTLSVKNLKNTLEDLSRLSSIWSSLILSPRRRTHLSWVTLPGKTTKLLNCTKEPDTFRVRGRKRRPYPKRTPEITIKPYPHQRKDHLKS